MDLSSYFEKTAKVVDIGGFEWKIRKLTIKEHRQQEESTKGASTDVDWIKVNSALIALAVVEPKLSAEDVENYISAGDMVELCTAIMEHSQPKKS